MKRIEIIKRKLIVIWKILVTNRNVSLIIFRDPIEGDTITYKNLVAEFKKK